jgi:glutamate carboxypeptidase
MKSGLIVALYSLIILQKIYPKEKLPIKILFNSDEEIGSYDSWDIITNEFCKARAGFVFEPGRMIDGYSIVTARKGGISIDIEIEGKAAHAGVEPQNGINAITAAAKIILKLNKLNDFENGITVGCNVINGGIVKNTVAPYCKIGVDVRYVKKEQYQQIMKDIEKILYEPNSEGAKVSYVIEHQRPPFEKTDASKKLYQLYKKIADEIGIECNEVATGGGSDANILSDCGVPCLDGLGAIGNFSHTKKEFTIKETIPKKIEHTVKFMEQLLR